MVLIPFLKSTLYVYIGKCFQPEPNHLLCLLSLKISVYTVLTRDFKSNTEVLCLSVWMSFQVFTSPVGVCFLVATLVCSFALFWFQLSCINRNSFYELEWKVAFVWSKSFFYLCCATRTISLIFILVVSCISASVFESFPPFLSILCITKIKFSSIEETWRGRRVR